MVQYPLTLIRALLQVSLGEAFNILCPLDAAPSLSGARILPAELFGPGHQFVVLVCIQVIDQGVTAVVESSVLVVALRLGHRSNFACFGACWLPETSAARSRSYRPLGLSVLDDGATFAFLRLQYVVAGVLGCSGRRSLEAGGHDAGHEKSDS